MGRPLVLTRHRLRLLDATAALRVRLVAGAAVIVRPHRRLVWVGAAAALGIGQVARLASRVGTAHVGCGEAVRLASDLHLVEF